MRTFPPESGYLLGYCTRPLLQQLDIWTMLRICKYKSFKCVWGLSALLLTLVHGNSQQFQERKPCQPGRRAKCQLSWLYKMFLHMLNHLLSWYNIYFLRFLLSFRELHSSPLSSGNLWTNCWCCVHRQLSEVSSSPLLPQTRPVCLPALWPCGSAASVWAGLLRLPGRGTELPGDTVFSHHAVAGSTHSSLQRVCFLRCLYVIVLLFLLTLISQAHDFFSVILVSWYSTHANKRAASSLSLWNFRRNNL